jgi:hypothetical protein
MPLPETPMARPPRRRGVALLVLLACAPAFAHDTWFHRDGEGPAGRWTLSLGTGNRFPVLETPLAAESLQQAACRQGDEVPRPLAPLRALDKALQLRTPPAVGGLSCWAQSVPFEIELPPDRIEIYLKEINASAALRQAWSALQARGMPWKERYTKHARIELPGQAASRAAAPGLAMDAVPLGDPTLWRSGDTARFQLLRDGQPLAGFPVELRNERAALGLWGRTDAEGRVQLRLPLPGRWVLRGTDLRLSTTVADTWESRFVTLAFDVGLAGPQAGSSLRSNARSTNQSAAIAAMATEPPTNTSR